MLRKRPTPLQLAASPQAGAGHPLPAWSRRPPRPDRRGDDIAGEAPAPVAPRSFLSVRQAADYLQVSEKSIRRRIAAGDLEAVRIGRSIRIPVPLRLSSDSSGVDL